ncbi:coiled-coil domain-containing protein 87 [Phascolarctos cinereus]|uniref:Coiled-coil domain-containing protein 87 n=1 Tax=Phascolarctos cinereus TaxID=38626 RepID=A0A6P5IZ98_PHACI|nr:coiled-coil domain-containing protein 87 [Phascolarctos cinereus]XP_020823904.1 coiled-coil domain-containing protein 87 [Phascolarctos cinereus]XP_020823905.1 coiled-coil domain-containing protein 87 [Phascolarctos cinereus]
MEYRKNGLGRRKRQRPPSDRTADPELRKLYHRLLRPLSLFPGKEARISVTPEPLPTSPQIKSDARVGRDSYFMEQLSPGSLCLLVSERLSRVGHVPKVPPEGRRRLAEVILSELQYGWQIPPPEPGLSPRDQQKLRQRVETHVVLSSEELFLRYLHLLITLSVPESVLTEPATLTRLSACLATDCSRFLTSPVVYRRLVSDFKDLQGLRSFLKKGTGAIKPDYSRKQALIPQQTIGTFQASKLCPLPWPHSIGFAQIPCSALNMNYLIHLSRPDFLGRPCLDRLKGLWSIPDLDQRKYLRWLPTVAPRPPKAPEVDHAPRADLSRILSLAGNLDLRTFLHLHNPRKCRSLPNLREGWKLSNELGICYPPPRTLTPLILAWETRKEAFIGSASEDLKHMMKNLKVELSRKPHHSSTLPPLLGALTRGPKGNYRVEELQTTLQTLQEEEASGKWEHKPSLKATMHPQPVTVALTLKDQMVLQAAAVRVSERAFHDSFFVKEESVLYNHLSGELDSRILEDLDAVLFAGASIQEIYNELLSRVSTDYLLFDKGPLVEPTSEKDWSSLMASTFLYRDPKYRVINPVLDGIGKHRVHTISLDPLLPLPTPLTPKQWAKSKASWMRWWKATLTPDDYFLYLATQDCDFLHVVFHMYPEEEPVHLPVITKDTLELLPLPPLAQEEDAREFVPGIWDANSVLEDGLGAEGSKCLGDHRKVKLLQRRLERIWAALQVPDKDRLDMAIKYSTNARMGHLPALVNAWEKALQPIQERELLLAQLEHFEQEASDPNRFFLKVDYDLWRWTEESQIRSHLYEKISRVEALLTRLLRDIQIAFGESVTYKGRCYLEKMKRDKVEMLYWLQQERRAKKLVRVQKGSQLPSLNPKNTGNSENGLIPSPRNV